jgi:hypothetical protein
VLHLALEGGALSSEKSCGHRYAILSHGWKLREEMEVDKSVKRLMRETDSYFET